MPKAITELFPRINNVHSYSTRNTDKFYHLSSCTNVRKMCITTQGPLAWEAIPALCRYAPSTYSFKSKYKKYQVGAYFSS